MLQFLNPMNNSNYTENDDYINNKNDFTIVNNVEYAKSEHNKPEKCKIYDNTFFKKIGFPILDYFEGQKDIQNQHRKN